MSGCAAFSGEHRMTGGGPASPGPILEGGHIYENRRGLQTGETLRTDKNGRLSHAGKKIWRSRYLYLLLLPTFVWYIVFMYAPLYGAQIAFRDFMPPSASPEGNG